MGRSPINNKPVAEERGRERESALVDPEKRVSGPNLDLQKDKLGCV